jgi:hypothetical protein
MGNLTVREQKIKAMHEAASKKRAAAAAHKARLDAARGAALDFGASGKKGCAP